MSGHSSQTTINERFDKALKAVGVKPAEIARQLRTEPVKLYNIISGRTKPSIQTLEEITDLFPQISTDYIIKGIGSVLHQPEAEILYQATELVPVNGSVSVPYMPVNAYGQFAEKFTKECQYPLASTFTLLNRNPKELDGCFVIQVQGHGMSPQINDGAKVLAQCIDYRDWRYQSGGVYAVLFGDHFIVRRIIENELLTKGTLTLHSDNRLGGVMTISQEDIRGVWKVLEVLENPVE